MCEAKWAKQTFLNEVTLHKTAQEFGVSLEIKQREVTSKVSQKSPFTKSKQYICLEDPEENADWNQKPGQ